MLIFVNVQAKDMCLPLPRPARADAPKENAGLDDLQFFTKCCEGKGHSTILPFTFRYERVSS